MDALLRQYPGVQLATLVDAPPEGKEWIHEIKFDGYRLLGFASGDDVCLRTRNGLDWTAKFPAIVEAMGRLKAKDAVLDMEAVVLDEQGKSSFQVLQAALGEGGHRERIIAFVFDLLRLDGKDLTGLRLTERKEKLEALLTKSKPATALRFSAHTESSGAEMLAKSCALGLEGIVSKLSSAPYRVGREKSWLKAKCTHRQEFIIVGYSDARTGDRALGALYLGYYKGGEQSGSTMAYAGKVGTGFSMKSARAVTARLAKLSVDKPVLGRAAMTGTPAGEWSAIHWTRPELLCEVEFTEWTGDGRIRHPSFQGLREDKKASGVKREEPVKKDEAAP